MAEKKTTTTKKPAAKKPEELVEKKLVEKKEEAQVAVILAPTQTAEEIAEEEEISKEIAKAIKENTGKDRYFEATGRRKTAVARVRLYTKGDKEFLVNNKPFAKYFTLTDDQETATSSMKKMKCLDKFRVTVIVKGGGHSAQAEAVRHGIARVLVDFNSNFRKRLRKAGFLTRDPRMRERKKFGLKRARKAPQWAKR
jgi:small subunit ribosomal protein S9